MQHARESSFQRQDLPWMVSSTGCCPSPFVAGPPEPIETSPCWFSERLGHKPYITGSTQIVAGSPSGMPILVQRTNIKNP